MVNRIDTDLLSGKPELFLKPGLDRASDALKGSQLRNGSIGEDEYKNSIVQQIRRSLVRLVAQIDGYTSVLIPGNDTAGLEALICSVIPDGGKLAVLTDSDYGNRVLATARYFHIPVVVIDHNEFGLSRIEQLRGVLQSDSAITHVAVVLSTIPTTQGCFLEAVSSLVKIQGKALIVEATNSIVDINLDIGLLDTDFIFSSTSNIIMRAPSFDFIVAKTARMQELKGILRTSSHALYEQWKCMDANKGHWRLPYPTDVLLAFEQSLTERLAIKERYKMGCHINNRMLILELRGLGFSVQSEAWEPLSITSFNSPSHPDFSFKNFANELKTRGVFIYPVEAPAITGFHFGSISNLYHGDISQLAIAVAESMYWHEEEILKQSLVANPNTMIAAQSISEIGWIP